MIGQTLAHYEITEQLGKGGMGEVYRARDTKLGRDVAIKLLPREMSGDPERIARFQREARTLATLQHNNIASIYGFEDTSEARFLVMELVEGEELAERLDRGAISIEDTADIARQIAQGLEAAHEQGIVHRDLKPANVKIAPDGTVKILDFGLARAYQGEVEEDADPANSPTITAAMTQAGTILGTAAYMSPEQARGKAIDKRADIWAFGVILYEMLRGRRLFEGETVSDTLAGVLKSDIDLSKLPQSTPPALRQLLGRCLDRNPQNRLRDIGEARVLLEHPLEASTAPGPGSSKPSRTRILAGGLGGVLVGALLMWLAGSSDEAPAPAQAIRFAIPHGVQGVPRSEISPDGTRLLFVDENRLWVRAFDAVESREVSGSEGAIIGAWSPDGEWIAWCTPTIIYRCRPDGSERSRICEVESDMHAWAGAIDWTEDGQIVFTPGDLGSFIVGEAGGDPKVLLAPEAGETDFHDMHALPGGKGFLFQVHKDLGFDTIDLWTGSERRQLLRMEGQQLANVEYTAGHLLFRRRPDNPGIWAVPFSLGALETTGEPFLVIPDADFVSASDKGDLAYVPESHALLQLRKLDALGRVEKVLGDPILGAEGLALSPDGTRAAITIVDEDEVLWVYDLEEDTRQRLTFTKGTVSNPSWSPDGEHIAFSSGNNLSDLQQQIIRADGSSSQTVPVRGMSPQLTSDGRYLLLSVWDESNDPSIGYVDLTNPDAEPTMLVDTQFAEELPALSPDERFVAYETLETGLREIVVKSFPGGEGTWQISEQGGFAPFWSTDGSKLYFSDPTRGWMMVVDVRSDPVRFSAPRRAYETSNQRATVATPDGGFLALQRVAGDGDGSYEVWLNWAATLEGR